MKTQMIVGLTLMGLSATVLADEVDVTTTQTAVATESQEAPEFYTGTNALGSALMVELSGDVASVIDAKLAEDLDLPDAADSTDELLLVGSN